MSGVFNLRTGIYNNTNCIGRDFVFKTRVLVSTIYDNGMNRYETMVFNSELPWEGDVSFNPNEISVKYYSNRENAILGHLSEVSSQTLTIN